ncbi:Dynein regulatory complex protein 11 [Gonapodya sp. JEL0774]|nr:Dynein regulatory complex protein 11 [Gonapodya sp. JEL0774]
MDEAAKIIQRSERRRQIKAKERKRLEIQIQARREKEIEGTEDTTDVSKAAIKIQKVYRGYRARQQYRRMLNDELVFLGMAPPLPTKQSLKSVGEPLIKKPTEITLAEKNRLRRKVIQKQHEEDYQAQLVAIKDKLSKVEAPDIRDQLTDSFRAFVTSYRREYGKFPEFPEEPKFMQVGFTFEQYAIELAKAAKDAESAADGAGEKKPGSAAGKKGDGRKDSKGAKEPPKGDAKSAKGAKGADDGGTEGPAENPLLPPYVTSPYVQLAHSHFHKFTKDWRDRDEKDNLLQKCDTEVIKRDKRLEVESEVKKEIYQVLKDELENLKVAAERSSSGKKSKGAKGKDKKKGKKEGKKGKGKKEKDLTAGRDMGDLLAELIQEGICQRLPTFGQPASSSRISSKPTTANETVTVGEKNSLAASTGCQPPRMNDFVGEYDILGTSVTKGIIEPTLGELKRVIIETCILPLGLKLPSPPVDPNPLVEPPPPPPELPTATSVMLYGPQGLFERFRDTKYRSFTDSLPGSGKTMLASSIVRETGALLLNLTPANTVGHYAGKSGTTKMLHMVFKVAKAMAPAVVLIEGAEMVFAKKVPKDDLTEPGRIKKELFKYIKALVPSDRVLVVATSRKPWEGDLKTMQPYFSKYIHCPRPDYNNRRALIRHFMALRIAQVSKTGMSVAEGVVNGTLARRGFNLGTLAKFMEMMSAGVIKGVVDRTLTERRVMMVCTSLLT